MQLIDTRVTFEDDADRLLIKTAQFIPASFLDDLADRRLQSHSVREGELMHVCRIPAAIADKWHREGFDIMRVPVEDIVKRLRKEVLDLLMATDKRI